MCFMIYLQVFKSLLRGLGGVAVRVLASNLEAAGLNLGPGTLCWKVGSYLLMRGGLQCRILTN